MSSYVLAIFSNTNGDPYTGPGHIGHVVRVAPYASMPVVDEFTSGGPLAHVACAPAVIQSRLIQGGVHVPIAEIEQIAGTRIPQGTLFPGIERALRHYGVAEVHSSATPPPGWVMNPAGGRLISPAAFPQYLAASQGGCIVMADPPPPVPPTPIEGPEMQTIQVPVTPAGAPAPNDPILVPGVTGSTVVQFASYGGCKATINLWNQEGQEVAQRVITLAGEHPGVIGPVELAGYLYQVFAAPPAALGSAGPAKSGVPYLLGLYPGTRPYTVSVS